LALRQAFTSRVPGGNDLYPRWVAGCDWLKTGRDPYSPATTLRIQQGIYGRPATPDEDQVAFAYPIYTVLLTLPLCLATDFATAHAVAMAALLGCVLGTAVLAQRAASAGGRGGVAGAFVMGAMSGLVAAPCGAPVMGAVLTWVTTTKSAVLGFAYLLAFSLGMCALLVAVGLSSGVVARLPHAGVWVVWVKRAFAALMFGVAEYYLLKAGQLWI